MRLAKLRQFNINGTTASVANQPLLSKPVNHWKTSALFPYGFCGEGLYFESVTRKGVNFDIDEVTLEAGASTSTAMVALGSNLYVTAMADAGDSGILKVIGVSTSGSTPSGGTAVAVSVGAGTSTSLCKMGANKFAVACRDAGTDAGKVICAVGTVTDAGGITLGSPVTASTGAIDDTGTAITMARSGVITIAYALASDHKGLAVSSVVTLNVPATFGTPVEFEAGADVNYPSICPVAGDDGSFVIFYQDGATANDPLYYNVGGVTAANVVTFDGSPTSAAGAAAAASLITVINTNRNEIAVSWVDNGIGHVKAGTVATTVVTFGSELEVLSAGNTPASLSLTAMGYKKLLIGYENDDVSDLGMVTTIDKKALVLTTGQTDVFAMAAVADVCVAALDGNRIAVLFKDDAASDVGTTIVGKLLDHVIDIRSAVASASYDGYLLHKGKPGLGFFAAYRITGTTNSSANTVMSTQPTLPYLKWNDVICLFKDRGMYVENDGTEEKFLSGVSKANRTIDVRSQTTSEAFEMYVLKYTGNVRTIGF